MTEPVRNMFGYMKMSFIKQTDKLIVAYNNRRDFEKEGLMAACVLNNYSVKSN